MYAPILALHSAGKSTAIACAVIAVVTTIACGMLGGWRQRHALPIAVLAGMCGAWVGGLPYLIRWLLETNFDLAPAALALITFLAGIYPATLGFGAYLMVLTILGLEQHQAFSALAHPGYKHFTRLRVRQDGSAVDGWVIGKVDTLDPDSDVVLVDHYTWKATDGDAG